MTHHTPILNMQDQERWFDSLDSSPVSPNYLVLMALTPVDDSELSFVGIYKIDIDWLNRTAQVAWDIFEQFRGRGMGKRLVAAGPAFCFDVLNLHKVECEILGNNLPSLACAEKAGFVREGTKRQSIYKMGSYWDSLLLGLLGDEWRAKS